MRYSGVNACNTGRWEDVKGKDSKLQRKEQKLYGSIRE